MAITIGQAILWFKGSTDDLEKKVGTAKTLVDGFSSQMEKTLSDVEKNFSESTQRQVAIETAAFTEKLDKINKSVRSEEQVAAAVEKATVKYKERVTAIQASGASEAEIATRLGKAEQLYQNQVVKIQATSVASEALQKKIAVLSTEYEAQVQKILAVEKADAERSATQAANAERAIGLMQVEAREMDKALDAKKVKDSEEAWKKHGESIEKSGKALESLGRGLEKLGVWMTAIGGAMTGIMGFFIKEAADGEEALAQLDNALQNNAQIFNEVQDEEAQANKAATDAMKKNAEDAAEATLQLNQRVKDSLDDLRQNAEDAERDFEDRMAESQQSFRDKMIAMQRDYQDKMEDLNDQRRKSLEKLQQDMMGLEQDYKDGKEDRQHSLNENLQELEENTNEKKKKLEEELAATTDAKKRAAIEKQIKELMEAASKENAKIVEKFNYQEAREKEHHDRAVAKLQQRMQEEEKKYQEQTAKINRENQQREQDANQSHQRETEKMQLEYAKRLADFDQERAKIDRRRQEDEEKLVRSQQRETEAYKAKFSEVERGEQVLAQQVKPSREELLELSKKLSETSIFDDDDIVRAESVGLVYNRIGKEAFPLMMQGAIDMSARFKTDLITNVRALGRALQDPEKAMMALNKAGVRLTEDQKEQIKSLMGQGKLYEAQMFILEKVYQGVGGSAKAQLESTSGQIQVLWRDLKEAGKAVALDFLPALKNIVQAIHPMIQGIRNWIDNQKDLKGEITAFVSRIMNEWIPAIQKFWSETLEPMFLKMKKYLEENPEQFAQIAFAVAALGPVLLFLGPIVAGLGGFFSTLAAAVTAVAAGVIILSPYIGPLTALVSGLALGLGQALAAFAGFTAPIVAFVATAGAAWALGRWIDSLIDKNKFLRESLHAVFDTLVELIDKFQEWIGLKDKQGSFMGEGSYSEDELKAWGANAGGVRGYATGGLVARSGLALVGERGPELVRLSAGDRVYNAQQTRNALSAASGGITITFNLNGMVVREEADIRRISQDLHGLISRTMRQKGLSAL